MKKRFIICINKSTKEQDEKFIEFIKSNKLAWWHWLSSVWLISDKKGIYTASTFRDEARRIFDDQHNLVIELNAEKDTWSGFGPKLENKSMFTWLKNNWKREI
jgi:hypothetical protein